MRQPITVTTDQMQTPTAAERDAARAAGQGADPAAAHAGFMAQWPCMNTVELRQPAALPPLSSLTVAAWNIERCKRVEDSAALIRRSGADIVLATEVDWGMARSGQRHTTRDLAAQLGMGYAFGIEFVELGTGDAFETRQFADVPNDHGLHGNAIMSRWPLRNVTLIPIDDGGLWYVTNPKNDGQLRVGGRMAIAAQIDTAAGPLTCVSVHYESESTPDSRAVQTDRLLAEIDRLYPGAPCIFGGDLNTAALTGLTRSEVMAGAPQEPMFAQVAAAGFGWRGANSGALTTRVPPERPAHYPLKTLDWLFTRGVTAHDPYVLAAVSDRGEYLSDHELISARLSL